MWLIFNLKKQWWIEHSIVLPSWAHVLWELCYLQAACLTLLQFAHFINDDNSSMYFKRLSWGLNGFNMHKALKTWPDIFLSVFEKVFTYLLSYTGYRAGVWRESGLGPVVWELTLQCGEEATQITSVPCVQLLCETMPVAMQKLDCGFLK